MKVNHLLLSALIFLWACNNTSNNSNTSNTKEEDSLLRIEAGADNYGMKTYVIAFLKRGPNRPQDSIHSAELQKAHMENISKMAETGKLLVAGPFLDNDSLRGIYIFDVPTIEEAKILTESDPAIQYGSLKMELKLWYGSAALTQINKIHKRLAKENP